jgi:hypothetical protein
VIVEQFIGAESYEEIGGDCALDPIEDAVAAIDLPYYRARR